MKDELELFLMEVPLFSDFTIEELRQITPLLTVKSYKKNEILFMENDPGDEFFIVKEGIVKIFRFEDSREVILDIFQRGDYFGEMAIIDEDQQRSATAQTIEPAQLYALNRNDFIRLLERKSSITLKLLRTAMQRLRRSNDLVVDLTTLDARSRIMQTILRLSEKHGAETEDGTWIDLRLTHQQLADMTSTVRETVTKTLLELQNLGLIEVKNKQIYIKNIQGIKQRIQ